MKSFIKFGLLAFALLTASFAATPAPAPKAVAGLIGTTYVSLTADLGDLRTPVTSNTLYGATLSANTKVLKFLDVGGSIRSQRLEDNKLDLANLQGDVNATLHTTVLKVFTPYVRGGLGWAFNKSGVHKYQALAYRVGAGVETTVLTNLTVGGEVYLSDVQKARAGSSQVNYQPYAVFWLNDRLGVKGAYSYAKQANSATYSAGAVLKF
jgi:opacity protein-like surface antigen